MKLFLSVCTCILLAQATTAQKMPALMPQLPKAKAFLPPAEKIKLLPATSPYKSTVIAAGKKTIELSIANMTSGTDAFLYLKFPNSVMPEAVYIDPADKNSTKSSEVDIVINAPKPGAYLIEMNVGVGFKGDEQFTISCFNGTPIGTQTIPIDNKKSKSLYEPQKLVFAVNLQAGKNFTTVQAASALWIFQNCQITAL